MKTKSYCSHDEDETYSKLVVGGVGCKGWEWMTKFGEADTNAKAKGVA